MKAPCEQDLYTVILDYLHLRGIPATQTNADRVWDANGRVRKSKVAPGWPDITACLPPKGRTVLIECKMPGRNLSGAQKWVRAKLEKAGALYIVAYSLDDVVRGLEETT